MNKVQEIYYLRGFAVLAVLMIHSAGVPTVPLLFLGTISHYAIPLFVLISGYVLRLRYQNNETLEIKTYTRKRIKSIIPQFLVFSVIYILYANRNTIGTIDFFMAAKQILLGDAYFHLWYFILIIQLYILYPFFLKIYNKFSNKEALLLILLFAQLQYDYFFNFYREQISLTIPYEMFTLLVKGFVSVQFYFFLGMYISDHYDSLKVSISKIRISWILVPIMIVSLKIYFTLTNNGARLFWEVTTLPILDILIIMFLFKFTHILSVNYSWRISLFFKKVGDHSFGIYLVHVFFLETSKIMLNEFNLATNYYYALVYIFTLIFSYIASSAISYLPYSEYIIGKHQTFKHFMIISEKTKDTSL
jgi:surface polysaccharide O-acyltransferase-like enzyme